MKLPSSFTDYTRALLGVEEYEKLAAALEGEQPVSIRLNEDKLPESSFSLFRSSLEHVPWSAAGYYLDKRLTFTFDPLFHAGCYYVQEASSMFVEQALRRYVGEGPVVMLDLCAAPGGKSTHARSVLPAGSLLVANEVIRNRSQVLAENLTKWGHSGVVVTNNDPADFSSLTDFFDVILTDVPCSGEGMFRKDPVAVSEWSGENVEICWQRQRRIVTDIWPCLKPGAFSSTVLVPIIQRKTKRTSVGYGMNSGRRYCHWKFLLTGILRVIYCRERTFRLSFPAPSDEGGRILFGSSPQTGRERWEYLGRAGEIPGKRKKTPRKRSENSGCFQRTAFGTA